MPSPGAIPFDQRELGIVQRAELVLAEDAGDLVDRLPPAASSRFMANSGEVCSHMRRDNSRLSLWERDRVRAV